MTKLNVLDIFSGIGGFDLGLEATGHFQTAAFCEKDLFCQAILKKHWPDVPIFDDIKTLKRSDINDPIDLICGGFPCQPFSMAGKRRGKDDDRDLWPEMRRVIAEFHPAWVIGENVAGFVNMELDRTILDLENQGYEVRPLIIPACAINAPHRRDRVWIIAHAKSLGKRREPGNVPKAPRRPDERLLSKPVQPDKICDAKNAGRQHQPGRHVAGGLEKTDRKRPAARPEQTPASAVAWLFAHPEHDGSSSPEIPRRPDQRNDRPPPRPHPTRQPARCGGQYGWQEDWPAVATRLCRMDDGLSLGLDGAVPRTNHRANRLKALGNSVVPQIPYIIGQAVAEVEGLI